MTKAVSLSLGAVATIFAASGLATLAVVETANPPAPAVYLTSTATGAVAPVGDLPNVSIETSTGTRTTFATTNGHVRVATMFYAHCPGVCPMTIGTLQQIDARLSERQRSQLNFVLLSLDPARDFPAVLHQAAQDRGLDGPRWLLGRTSESDARSFAAAARIQYRPLSDGSIDHSTGLVLLDEQGRVIARADDTGDLTDFLATLRGALDRPASRTTP